MKNALRFLSGFTALAVVFLLVGGVFFTAGTPSAQAHVAVQGDFVNNGVPGGNVGSGTNILALDITLPAPDADTFFDGDGSDSTAAGAQEAIADGTALVRFVAADNVCVTDADGGAIGGAITRAWVDDGVNEANCGVDGGAEVFILGAAGGVGSVLDTGVGASTRPEMTHRDNVAANGAYNRTGDANALNDEDIYVDNDQSLFYNAEPLDAVTVRNAGTAVVTTDIQTVRLWTETSGNGAFGTNDTTLDVDCAWDGVDDWVCEGVNPGDTLALYAGLVAPRIYVTIDKAATAIMNRTVQMRIPVLVDVNVNSNFDAGDAGVIFSNDAANNGTHDGPPTMALTNANVMTFIATSGGGSTTMPPADNPPNAPSGVTAMAGQGKVDLAWTNTMDADFASVKIYRSTTSGTLGAAIASALTGTAYSDTTVTGGTTYYYTVRSVDKGGNESTNTVQVNATPTAAATTPPGEQPPAGQPPSGQLTPESSGVADGDLIRASNTVEIYVTKKVGATVIIRHIVNPRVFDSYGHFGGVAAWSRVVGVNSLGSARVSAWVRGSDGKVWEVNGDGTRHHMQMTWQQFASRIAGGDSALATNLIFEVNASELGLYAVGAAVLP